MKESIGIDVGGTSIKAVRATETGVVSEHFEVASPGSAAEVVEAVVAIARRMGPGLDVGVGCNGLVDHRSGALVWSPHLLGSAVPLRHLLSDRLEVRVVVDNDANLAAIAEHRIGAGSNFADMALVTVGTGIGVGIIVEGQLQHGRGHAGEAGHVTADPTGTMCPCGRRGCWETKVSGRRLDQEAEALFGTEARGVDLVRAAAEGHPQAESVLVEMGDWLAWGIEMLVLTIDPGAVIVGGAAGAVGEMWLERVRERLDGTAGGDHRPPTAVMSGILGKNAGAIGAALVVADGEATTVLGSRIGGQNDV